MIKKPKSLVTQHQETSTLQQNKDLHIIQKPKNLVLGLMMLLHQNQQKLHRNQNQQKLHRNQNQQKLHRKKNQKAAVVHMHTMKNQQKLKLNLKKKQMLKKKRMNTLQEWQKKEPLYQKDSSKTLKQLVHTNH